MSETRRGFVLILSAPSGAGKSTLAQNLVRCAENIHLSVSTTTRPPRPGEKDGVHYHFLEKASFLASVEKGEFLEWAEVFGHHYGTSRLVVEAALQRGEVVVLDIDWQGARAIRRSLSTGDVVGVSIVPPSRQALQDRLEARGQDDAEVIRRRMDQAREQVSHWSSYDYLIINDVLATAQEDLLAIVRAERLTRARMAGKVEKIVESF